MVFLRRSDMFLFLGGEVTVKEKDIIGIFDIEECSVSRITADYLNSCQKKGQVVYVSQDMPKSFIVSSDKVYISNISNDTINKRAKI
ncbi:MAG: DUF370 domain-containing protein [Oscillospiraceae bacterium]|nr:DUF370 domain-containing protein [Oscillospiraceae bacterium]